MFGFWKAGEQVSSVLLDQFSSLIMSRAFYGPLTFKFAASLILNK